MLEVLMWPWLHLDRDAHLGPNIDAIHDIHGLSTVVF